MSYFDSENEAKNATTGFEPLPSGSYQCMISAVEVAETKKKREGLALKGEVFKTTFVVLNDKFANRQLISNYNMEADNPKAEQIGRGQFGRLCKAAGVDIKIAARPDDFLARKVAFENALAPLKGRVVVLKVGVTDDGRFNDVKDVATKEVAAPSATGKTDDASIAGIF